MKESDLSDADATRLREIFSRIPFVNHLRIEFDTAPRGEAAFYVETRPELTRMEGIMHGGAIASLIDTAAACCVHTLLEPGQRTVTIELTIHYLRPVTDGRIRAHAQVLRDGRHIVSVSVEVTDQNDKLVATALTTYMKQR